MPASEPYCSEPEAYDLARQNVVLRAEVGSTVYGTGLPGHEDHDEMAVYIMPPTHVLGTRPVDSIVWRTAGASAKSTPEDTDLSMYSIRKYLMLAAAGNPSMLVMLFTPSDKVFELTEVGVWLRGSSDLFVTRKTGYRFLGYMREQRRKMEESRAGLRAPRTNRPDLIEQFGFDTKYAMHMLRLGIHGIELMTTGTLVFPIPPLYGDTLRAVRRGEVPYEDVLAHASDLEARLETVLSSPDLPVRPNPDEIDNLIWRMHWVHWNANGEL